MTEYVAALLELGQRQRENIPALRSIVRALRTTEAYMSRAQWEIYVTLQRKVREEDGKTG